MLLSRRLFCCAVPAAGFLATALPAAVARAENVCAPITPEMQKDVTPDMAIQMLKDGHDRFLAGKTVNCDLLAQVKVTGKGQAPIACVVGCIDSRVPPELVFDQQIGDIFSARVAGNFVNTDIIGSLEFATKVAGAKAIVVLGHSSCGAIKGAIDNVQMGNLTATLANLMPAVEATPLEGEKSSHNDPYVQKVADTNVALTVAKLTADSAVLKDLVDGGQLKIVGAMHDVKTGRITFLA